MAAQRPAEESAEVTPTQADSTAEASVADTSDPIPAAPDSTLVEEPTTVDTPADVPVVAAVPAHQVVYVEAPKPFASKGNRGFGVLIALLSTVIYAALYAAAEVVSQLINRVPVDTGFLSKLDFYAPVLMFAVGFVILVLIVNRAGWAAHVLGSLFVGLFVYFGATGVILLIHINEIPSNEAGTAFTQVLFSTGAIIAALLAREVALWMGFVIAARGRRVKARNVDARQLYESEIAAKRAEYEQANARSAAATAPSASVEESPAAAPVVVEEPVEETATP